MITPVNLQLNKLYSYNNLHQTKQKNVSFCSRTKEDENVRRLSRIYINPTRSYIFRRNSGQFEDVANAIKYIFRENPKPKILVVGVGKGEEPLSYLAVIKTLFKDKKLDDIVDLNCVDLLSKFSDSEMIENSFLPSSFLEGPPEYAKNSFVWGPSLHSRMYSFRLEGKILKFAKKIFDNKTLWNTKIEDYAAKAPNETYNLISMNNVLMYIESHDEKIKAMENISRMLKPNGILVTDGMDESNRELFKCLENFINIAPGIWRKLR